MSKSHSGSPLKGRQNSVGSKPFYMPEIKSKPSQQSYGSPFEGRSILTKNITATEMSTSRLDSNRSFGLDDSPQRTEELETAPSPFSRPRISPTKDAKYHSPTSKNKQDTEYRTKLIQRSGSDLMQFKEIFVAPKQQLIRGLKERERGSFTDLSRSKSYREFEKTGETTKEDTQTKFSLSPVKTLQTRQPSLRAFSQTNLTLLPIDRLTTRKNSVESLESPRRDNVTQREIIVEEVEVEDEDKAQEGTREHFKVPKERLIFEFQVKVQAPASYTGSGPQSPREKDLAPALYQSEVIHSPKMNLKDFTMRNRLNIGAKMEDLSKDGNLNFDIGTLHEERKEYRKAIGAFEKYLHNAKNIKDKIGMVLAYNRLGINYFHRKRYKKSLENHLLSLEITNVVDCFVAYYNIGLTLRKMKSYSQALTYLQKALDWAREFKDLESECITFGQIGVTYLEMKDYEASKESFQSCYGLTMKLKHVKLQLDCLINISKVCRASGTWDSKTKSELWKIYKQAYSCAKKIEKNKIAEICLCNMGVLEGLQKFQAHTKTFDFNAIKGLYK